LKKNFEEFLIAESSRNTLLTSDKRRNCALLYLRYNTKKKSTKPEYKLEDLSKLKTSTGLFTFNTQTSKAINNPLKKYDRTSSTKKLYKSIREDISEESSSKEIIKDTKRISQQQPILLFGRSLTEKPTSII